MRKILTFAWAILLVSALSLHAAVVGEASPLADGTPDGWSGITIMNGYGGIPAGEMVTTVNYYASQGRADGNHNVQPVIAKQVGGAYTIWDIGPVATPATAGEHSFAWQSQVIPNDGNLYHPGFWQWQNGVDNTDGGLVAFGDGGSGMFQQDQDGTSYVPAIGDDLTTNAQHSSGAGGRAYQFNFTTAVPEPGSIALTALAIVPLALGYRRRLKK
jgi:hypothetical protein